MAVITETPTHTTKVPSGVTIDFYAGDHSYEIDGQPVVGVTQVLDVLFKDLAWWGQETGVKGVQALWEKGLLSRSHPDGQLAIVHPTENVWTLATYDLLVEQLKLQKLTTSNVVGRAGDRGQAAHDALERWAVTREFPTPETYPAAEQPYIGAVRNFCLVMDDWWETQGIEVVVGSKAHGYAGRYDLRGIALRDIELASRVLRKDGSGPLKSGGQTLVIEQGQKVLFDLKTSKGVYPQHLLQLAAYEGAGRECGYEPTDRRLVIHATMHGVYEVEESLASQADFLAVLEAYHVHQNCKLMLGRK